MLTMGFTEYSASTTYQTEGPSQYCSHSKSGGIETFQLTRDPNATPTEIQRCEQRVNNDYTSGVHQFEGDVNMTMGQEICVHQVFLFLMIVGYPQNGGTFDEHASNLLGTGTFGNWVHVNTIHDVSAHQAKIYLNCELKYTMPDAQYQGSGWYNKYGLYGINSMPPVSPMSQVQWKNIHYWKE
jgi:hypothetical protein